MIGLGSRHDRVGDVCGSIRCYRPPSDCTSSAIRSLLVEQVTGSVRWRESIGWMTAQGVTGFWEIGAGKALSGMIRRIAKEAETRAVGTPEDVVAAKG